MSTQPQPADLTAIQYRLEAVERDVKRVSDQLSTYVPARENDLKLQSIQETVKRIEQDVIKAKDELVTLNNKLTQQERDSQERDTQQREERDKLQIRVLWFIVSSVIAVALAVLVAYLTHLIH